MRVAFDAKRYFHNATGLGRYSRELVDGLSKYYPENEYLLCNPLPVQEKSSGNIDVLTASGSNKMYAAYWRSIGVVKELKKRNVNIYHGLSNELPLWLRRAGIRSAVSIHDMIYLRYPNLYKSMDRWVYEQKVEYAVTHADAVIATSHQTADDISFFYPVRPNRIVVVYQSVSLPQPDAMQVQATMDKYGVPDRFFLYVGRVEERKNLLGILEAMTASKNRKWSLAVVGKPHTVYYKQCMDFIQRNGLQTHVQLYPNVTREELAAFYQRSIGLVYPSYFEGFGIPIAEAQLSGTAVITSTGGCFAETAGEAALFINPSEPMDIAEAMHKLDTDLRLRDLLITRGRENAKRFSAENFAASVMGVYNHLV
jgi:glycosyltransferase involved in cell wall biosynthesis